MRCCTCASGCGTSTMSSGKDEGTDMVGRVGRFGRLIWIAPLAIVAMVAFGALGGWVVMRLWNWLTPPIFGWHTITFWQAFGLLVLTRILFGGLGLHGNAGSHARRRMRERWEHMS